MSSSERQLLSGDEAIALAARARRRGAGRGLSRHAVHGNPRTLLRTRRARPVVARTRRWRWKSPSARPSAARGRMATMKHVGLNVAADPLFTAAYTGVSGALVVVSADDPGHGLQPERAGQPPLRRRRRRADARAVRLAGGLRLLPAAVEISERWKIPVLLRVTTRVCHSKTVVRPRGHDGPPKPPQLRARHPRPRDDPGLCPAGPPAAAAEAGRDPGVERDLSAEPRDRRAANRSASSPRASPSCTPAKPRRRPACSSSASPIRCR